MWESLSAEPACVSVRSLQLTEAVPMARANLTSPPPIGLIRIGDRRLTLGGSLGKGSMASVYRGTLEAAYGVRRAVACKLFGVISSDEREAVLETLRHAVQRAACIRHPNVVDTYELGQVEGQPFIVSELVEGTSLARLMEALAARRRRMPLDLAMFIATEVAEGLTGARAARSPEGDKLGIAHLELSPRDVLLSWAGEVKVTDFGLGSARQAASSVRSLATMARRADTMSPEVARGAEGDGPADVFSLGIILRQLLVGPRFAPDVSDAEALKYARDGFVQPFTFQPHLPAEVHKIMLRALDIDPERRFPHAGAMAYDLRHVALKLGVGDSRVFLRAMLETEVTAERSDATIQFPGGRQGSAGTSRVTPIRRDKR